MPGLNEDAHNLMLDELAAVIGFASLHTADPGANGASEVAGGSPAYARKAVVWIPATGEIVEIDADPAIGFDVPAGTTVRYVGMWSAVSGGTFYGSGDVADTFFSGQGNYNLTALSIGLVAA